MGYPLILTYSINCRGVSSMKTALLVFALAPFTGAQSRDSTWSDKGGVRVCQSLQRGHGKYRSTLRFMAATSSVPCPEYLATTILNPKRRPIWT
jgi:hypothetical protein